MPRWDHQKPAIELARQQVRQGSRSVCLVCPTGGGKTKMGAMAARASVGKGRRVLWLTDRRELGDQARAVLPADALVLTAQSLVAAMRRGGELPRADFVVFDECHHGVARTYFELIWHYRRAGAIILGLTATPQRGDGSPLGDVFQSMVVAATHSQLLAAGCLVPCRMFAPRPGKGLAMPVEEALARWQRPGEQALIFSASVADARALTCAIAVDGRMKREDRAAAVDAFRRREIQSLASVDLFAEGLDVPQTRLGVFATRVCSEGRKLQMTGRLLRSHPGKTEAIVVDLCGTLLEDDFGWPTDDRTYSLDGTPIKAASSSAAGLWRCKRCAWVERNPPSNRRCANCGCVLAEPERLAVQRRRVELRERVARHTPEQRLAYWDVLQKEAAVKGHHWRWAQHRYEGRYKEPAPPRRK